MTMMMMSPIFLPAIILPPIDPIAVSIGPFAVRWYALAYICGILFAWWRGKKLASKPLLAKQNAPLNAQSFEDFVVWGILGIVLGGRLGFVLFYQPGYYASHPLDALKIWQGGMSFHGGLIGVMLATLIFCRRRSIKFFALSDIIAQLAPVGIGLGRMTNFINNELWGRASDVPWAMVFPNSGSESGYDVPRHPSQIYEFLLEGIILFTILWFADHKGWRKYPGRISGLFLIFYGLFRIFVEFFREPDSFMGYFLGGITMGQILSIPLILVGMAFVARSKEST